MPFISIYPQTLLFSGRPCSPERSIVDEELKAYKAELERDGRFETTSLSPKDYALRLQDSRPELRREPPPSLARKVAAAAKQLGFKTTNSSKERLIIDDTLKNLRVELEAAGEFSTFKLFPLEYAEQLQEAHPELQHDSLRHLARKAADSAHNLGFNVASNAEARQKLLVERCIETHLSKLKKDLIKHEQFDSYTLYPRKYAKKLKKSHSDLQDDSIDSLAKRVKRIGLELGFTIATHSDSMKLAWKNPQHRSHVSNQLKSRWLDDEYREHMSALMRQRWRDDDYKVQKSLETKRLWNDDAYRERVTQKVGEASRNRQQDPEYKIRMSEIVKGLWQDPEYRERMLQILQSPEFREKTGQISKKRWQDPKYRKHMRRVLQDPELREKMSRLALERWSEASYRNNVRNGKYRQLEKDGKRRWVTQVVGFVNHGTGKTIDLHNKDAIDPAEHVVQKEESEAQYEAKKQSLQLLETAMKSLRKEHPDSFTILLDYFGFKDSGLTLSDEEQKAALDCGLTFLRELLSNHVDEDNPFEVFLPSLRQKSKKAENLSV